MFAFEAYNRYIKTLCFNNHWPMASVANSYIREANMHYKYLRDTPIADLHIQTTCILEGRKTRWKSPPADVVSFLFGSLLLIRGPDRVDIYGVELWDVVSLYGV